MTITPLTIADLSSASVSGTGAFDVLMKATKAHLEQEFDKNRIKGPEYATVYLGSLDRVMQTALAFLLEGRKADLEAQLTEKQIELAAKQVELADKQLEKADKEIALAQAQIDLAGQELLNKQAELALLEAQQLKIPAEIELLEAQAAHTAAETLNVPKQGALIDAQKDVATQQVINLATENLGIEAKTALTEQQTLNAVKEGEVLAAQKCKLQAEYDLLIETKTKTTAESALLAQKTATERAQVQSLGVDEDSVIGRQKGLYVAQAEGFQRDAEQKAAQIMVSTWNIQRTTDNETPPNATNQLHDASVGAVIGKLKEGIGL